MDHYQHIFLKNPMLSSKTAAVNFSLMHFRSTSIDDFKKRLTGLKKEHPKAVHHCFAYQDRNRWQYISGKR